MKIKYASIPLAALALFGAGASSASAAVAPFPDQPALKTTEQYQTLQDAIKSVNALAGGRAKTVKRCSGGKCTTKTIKVDVDNDALAEVTDNYNEAASDLQTLVGNRATERSESTDEWLSTTAEALRAGTQSRYDGATEANQTAYEQAQGGIEQASIDAVANADTIYQQWIATNVAPDPSLTAGNYSECLRLVYGDKASSLPKKPSKPKLNGKWPRSTPTKTKNGKTTQAYKDYTEDKAKMEAYNKAVSEWTSSNGAMDTCSDESSDADADAWKDNRLANIELAAQKGQENAQKAFDSAQNVLDKTYEKDQSADDKTIAKNERDTEKALSKQEDAESKAYDKLDKEGQRALGKLQ